MEAAAEYSGDQEAFAEWLDEYVLKAWGFSYGLKAAVRGEAMLRALIDSKDLETLLESTEEVGTGEYMEIEDIGTLIREAESAEVVTLEDDVAIGEVIGSFGIE